MELRPLQYFVAVVRHGQFTRAAEELWITQPALSQQVRPPPPRRTTWKDASVTLAIWVMT
jgi:hypothetical protein